MRQSANQRKLSVTWKMAATTTLTYNSFLWNVVRLVNYAAPHNSQRENSQAA